MRKIWFGVGVLWLVSIVYFLIYVNTPALRTLVDTTGLWAGVHVAADFALIGGGIALIIHFIRKFVHHDD
ncbi:hypothetical protein [Lacticaseibacillus mingshuiensis]|uniref:DUF3923 family protein n=1 Tax=Lacticaseibacillus mingshuiensis TaxID=2799574 RepID=A0ABW4CKH0_9LACO|nr:hypothetical protein [Lacticaseibacillus mingshuiensis]